jgi:glycosyltransferase involved in cell wall biosynthesis
MGRRLRVPEHSADGTGGKAREPVTGAVSHAPAILLIMQQSEADVRAPLVSVIVPAYRTSQFIAATLDSILAQTFQDFEIIVVNDGSPDSLELEKVLEPYRNRINYLRQENQGPAGARNAGIRASRGAYISPLDSDDLWHPEHLAAQLAVLRADPALDMVYADARIFGDVPEAGKTLMELRPSRGEVTLKRLVTQECSVSVCACLIRREILFRAGLFEQPTPRGTEDIDMWLRIVMNGGRIVYQRRTLAEYRRHSGGLSSNTVAMIESFIWVLSKIARSPGLNAADREVIERQIQVERARMELEQGKHAFLAGDRAAAVRHLSRANMERKSFKLFFIIALLRVAPGFLKTLYEWRNRHVH